MNIKRLGSGLLAISLLATTLVACGEQKEVVDTPVILGSTTELSGDFRWAGAGSSSAGASDQDIQGLVTGYATMELDRTGSYVWNEVAVKSHTQEEVPGTNGATNLKITIELNKGLKDSKGNEVKAANYLAYALAFSSPVGAASQLAFDTSGRAFVGYADFNAYDGTSGTNYFSGLRLIDEYTFSIEIDGYEGYYPYYYADTYGAVSPQPLDLVLGEGVEVKDDGNGAYLTAAWYEKDSSGTYVKAAHLDEARYDVDTYAYTGAYVVSEWNEGTKEATLKINPYYAGNFEGQKPSINTLVYRYIIQETQMQQLANGEVDVITGLTGGDEVNEALALISKGGFSESHYDRAGYGKLEFECDFGPGQFQEVRQAVAYSFDRNEFANTFCTGYGSLINGPYSVNFQAAQDEADALDNLEDYAASLESAKKVLEEGGWTYNSKGENLGANWTVGTGVDAVRYKKLSADEYGVNEVNKTYAAVSSEVAYKTVKIGNDYYLPLVINWFCTENNSVSDLLTTNLKASSILAAAGIVITKTEGNFTKLLGEIYREASYGYGGTPTYCMFNLATGFSSALYDWAYNWIDNSSDLYETYFDYSANKLSDPYDADFKWDDKANQGKTYDEAYAASNGKLGMNYISFAMVYSVEPGDTEEYNKWFVAYMQRWNELLPDIPLYCNIYYDVYNSNKITGMNTSPFWGPSDEIVYQSLKK